MSNFIFLKRPTILSHRFKKWQKKIFKTTETSEENRSRRATLIVGPIINARP